MQLTFCQGGGLDFIVMVTPVPVEFLIMNVYAVNAMLYTIAQMDLVTM